MYPDGTHGRRVNSACQGAFSRFRAKPHDRWATDSTWDFLVGELSADADAAGELDWLVGVDSSINRTR